MSGTWRVAFLGSLEVSCGGTVLRFATRKAAALFAFLAYHPGKPFTRDYLISLFWPDDDVERARNSLRVALSGLKKQMDALGAGDLLRADRVHLSVAADSLDTDIAAFRACLRREQEEDSPEGRREQLRAAVALYRGPLLEDWYEDWITPERERLTESYAAALRRLASLLMDSGMVAEALESARKAVAAEPLREEGHRRLIELYRQAGQQNDAVRQYRELERLLRDELGVAPSRETQGLMARALAERDAAPAPATPAGILPTVLPPLPDTSFVGREREIRDLSLLLFREGATAPPTIRPGVAAVIGVPGVGKSRLVGETLRRAGLVAPGKRLWHLSLENARTTGDIATAFGRILSAPVTDPDATGAALFHRLGPEPGILFLDDVDGAPEAVAPFLRAISHAAPELLVVVTGPQPFGLGERLFTLTPLSLAEAPEEGAIRLFDERARAVNPSFGAGARSAGTVAELCRSLDGIPLALETAASWAGFMTPEEMIQRLASDPFAFLTHQRADCPPRHRSPGARFQAYCRALPEDACGLLGRLAVFRGGWTLADAEFVTGESRSLALLSVLERRGVITVRGAGDAVRFSLGELTRRFILAMSPLETRRDDERRHAERFVHIAREYGPRVNSRDGAEAVARLRVETENLTAALENCLGALADPETALRLVAALWRFWYAEREIVAGYAYLERAVGAAEKVRLWEVHGQALEGLGRFALNLGHLTLAVGVFQDALDAARSHADTSAERLTVLATGLQVAACARGDFSRVREVSKLLLALKTREGDLWAIAAVRNELARASVAGGAPGDAHRAEARRLLQDLGFDPREADTEEGKLGHSFLRVGHLAVEQGDYAEAAPILQEAVHAFQVSHDVSGTAVALERLGIALERMGDDTARAVLEEALALRLSGVGAKGAPFTRRLLARTVSATNDRFTVRTLLTETRHDERDGTAFESRM